MSLQPSPRLSFEYWIAQERAACDARSEYIDGVAFAMSPAPSTRHHAVTLRLSRRIEKQLRVSPCRPVVTPTDVRLSEHDGVQPDILVVCERGKITESHSDGRRIL